MTSPTPEESCKRCQYMSEGKWDGAAGIKHTPTCILQQARTDALDAAEVANDLEAQARRARRTATSKMRHYEDLLAQHQGQLTIEDAL